MTNDRTSATTVLFVDDSITDRTLAAGLIRKAHPEWDVVILPGAQDAFRELTRRRVDIVVTDLVMPQMDGRQFLKLMGHNHPLIPVVLVTSQGNDRIAAECLGLGAVNYVPKRRMAEDLVAVLDNVLLAEGELIQTRRVLQYVVQNRCQFEVDSDLDQIWSLLNFIRERLHAMQIFPAGKVQNVTAAIRESLLNAYFHGSLRVNSHPLELPRTAFAGVAEKRRQDPVVSGSHIRLTMSLEPGSITFCVGDDGPGFDLSCLDSLTGPPQEQFPNGNGVRQMRMLMDHVSYNEAGNEVSLTATVEDTAGPRSG